MKKMKMKMKLAEIILLEVTQTKKDICHMFCLMGGAQFKSVSRGEEGDETQKKERG